MISQDNSTQSDFFLIKPVEKGFRSSIRARIETLLHERGIKWSDVYSELGWHKSFASKVLNGRYIPPSWQRVSLAKVLEVDSSVIWPVPPIYSAEKVEAEQQGEVNSSPEPEIVNALEFEEKLKNEADDGGKG